MYEVNAHNKDIVEITRESLLFIRQLYPEVSGVMSSEALTDLLNELISVARSNSILVDAATFTRYELVDRLYQPDIVEEQQAQVAELLDSVLEHGEKAPQLMDNVIDSGHQIVSYLVSLYEPSYKQKSKLILETQLLNGLIVTERLSTVAFLRLKARIFTSCIQKNMVNTTAV